MIGGASPERVAIPELGVAPPDDSGTDLEDELLNISPLPTIVSPLPEPDEALPVSSSLYPEPPVPAQPDPAPSVESRVIPLRESDERPTIDLFPSYLISPAQSYYDPATSPVTSDLQDDSEFLLPDSPATMDQYLATDGDLLLGDSSELPLLSLPLLPIPVADVSVLVLASTPSVGEQFPASSVASPDLSREGPFDVARTASGLGATPQVLESLPGCQYRMTSYDIADRTDVDPAYGLHLHDPRFLEYVGAPESARLLSRAPGYWLHHMNRDQAISAALQLQCDAGLMMSNLQVLGQFLIRGDAVGIWPGTIPVRSDPVCGAVSTCSAGSPLHGCDGFVASAVVPRVLPGPCRPRHAIPACCVLAVSRTYVNRVF